MWGINPNNQHVALNLLQELSATDSRLVYLEFKPGAALTESPRSIFYSNRQWTYTYLSGSNTALATAVPPPPTGPGWAYEYDGTTGDLIRVTTPHGGSVQFAFDNHQFVRDVGTNESCQPNPLECPVITRVVKQRKLNESVVWQYDYAPSPDPQFKDLTTLRAPNGAVTEFYYAPTGLTNPTVQVPEYQLLRRVLRPSVGAVPIETETRSYVMLQVSPFMTDGSPELAQATVIRDGVTYRTTHEYAAFGDHSSNYHRPWKTTETGNGPERITAYLYDYASFPGYAPGLSLIRGKLASMTVTESGGGSFTKSWAYNLDGFTAAETAYGLATTFRNDGRGNVEEATKGNGTWTRFSYRFGVISNIQTAAYSVARVINPEGAVASETRAGRTTSFRYDNAFRIIRTTPPGGSNWITTDYDNAGGQWFKVTRGGSSTTTIVDGFGRPVYTVNSADVRRRMAYDEEGKMTYEGLPYLGTADRGVTMTHDVLGRVTRRRHSDNSEATFAYGSPGLVTITDENGRTTRQSWASVGSPERARLVVLQDAKGHSWNYSYNTLGSLTRVSSVGSPDRTWTYDSRNLLVSETHPESGTVTYPVYDDAGLLRQKNDARGTVFSYVYDANDRLMSIQAGDKATSISYEPGTDNRAFVRISRGGAVQAESTFSYDSAGRLSSRKDAVAGVDLIQTFDYDGNDNLRVHSYPDGRRVKYSYDSENRVTQVLDETTGRVYADAFAYHATGAPISFRTANNLTHVTQFDQYRYWPTRITAGPLDLTYTNYDAVGNVRSILDPRPGRETSLQYDELDRLTNATSGNWVVNHAYDPHGNRANTAGATYAYDPATMRLTAQNGIGIQYDDNGNITGGLLGTYTYSPDNMVDYSAVGADAATYVYDVDGWRLRKDSGGTTSVYARGLKGELIQEYVISASGARSARDYIYAGGRLIAAVKRTFSTP
jgi:YD repeat-containing protein